MWQAGLKSLWVMHSCFSCCLIPMGDPLLSCTTLFAVWTVTQYWSS